MSKKADYQTQSFSYTSEYSTAESPIDYFEIPVDVLQTNNFKVTHNELQLVQGEQLSVFKHLSNIDHSYRETVVLNIQTGIGKTTACYELIEQYAQKGYMVLVLSPFKKLVQKDYNALVNRGLKVFNYENLEVLTTTNSNQQYLECDVQVMTINCLLQNPGEDAFAQAGVKQRYLNDIYNHCFNTEKKVVLFFDEIHESIKNFHAEYVPSLLHWADVAHKCYISSATYTPASIFVVQYIAALTNGYISIYEMPRQTIPNPVGLHIHLINKDYSARRIQPLKHISKIIRDNSQKQINILIGHKSLVNALTDKRANPDDIDIVNTIMELNPNIITGDRQTYFQPNGHNVGTAFKTGIDIQNPNSVFIIVLPCINDKITSYGVFNDGIPSIVQSIGRLRQTDSTGAAQIHIFMRSPSHLLNKESSKRHLPDVIYDNTEAASYTYQNAFTVELLNGYYFRLNKLMAPIVDLSFIQDTCPTCLNEQKNKSNNLRLGYSYPSISDYFIEKSQNHLLKNHFCCGKELSPYLLWAALNDQFTNAILKEITYTSSAVKIINISGENIEHKLQALLSKQHMEQCKKYDLLDGLNHITKSLEYISQEDENSASPIVSKTDFTYNERRYTIGTIKSSTFFAQALVNTYVNICTAGVIRQLSKEDYILACCKLAARATKQELLRDRTKAYYNLNIHRAHFLSFLSNHIEQNDKGELLIHKDIYAKLSKRTVAEYQKAMEVVNIADPLLRNKTYQFRAKRADTFTENQESIYKAFEKCFTNVTKKKRMYNAQKDGYYLIAGKLERTIPVQIGKLKLL